MYVPSSTLAPYYRRTTAPATRRHRGAMRGPLPACHRHRPTPAVVPWRVSAEAALAPQSRRRRRRRRGVTRRRRRCRRRRCWP